MKEYGYGVLMNDYVYLEDVGRKVRELGRDISNGKYQVTERDRVGSRRRRKSRKDALPTQLEIRGIPLILLPPGMERKKLNKSYWDYKLRSFLLFISHRGVPNDDCVGKRRHI